ncbi:hypothetical protein RFI_39785 [Reticulomyxa filosa]|uniref:Uncharacterized protein n=1 Tax=Reticulomyxa filosa TaxID=46433 RepID=X6L8C3_RETFI|nr:hypothetical protein RFI_39785 [Reticulomyxa filosa]|eukprot:ETN97740.1 hypothetical protein RFI_39785 [Reticulomyxa filosa]
MKTTKRIRVIADIEKMACEWIQTVSCSKGRMKDEQAESIYVAPLFKKYNEFDHHRSFKEELKDCDQLWELSQNKNTLFWSVGICYSLLKTTGVEMWDQLFAHESSFIEKYGTLGATAFDKINNFFCCRCCEIIIPFFAIFEKHYVSGAVLSIVCLENFFFTCFFNGKKKSEQDETEKKRGGQGNGDEYQHTFAGVNFSFNKLQYPFIPEKEKNKKKNDRVLVYLWTISYKTVHFFKRTNAKLQTEGIK